MNPPFPQDGNAASPDIPEGPEISSPDSGDAETTVGQLRELVQQFVTERDWDQFHAPKNLVMALAIEAAELMEHFQWMTVEESRAIPKAEESLHAVAEELADVVCYALALTNVLGIDLTTALRAKMVKNRHKYPAQQFQGRYR